MKAYTQQNIRLSCFSLLLVALTLSSCNKYVMDKRPKKLLSKVVQARQSYDVAIVPGYPFDGQNWDKLIKARITWAYKLYNDGIVRNIIFSGAAVHTPYVEAEYMRRYAIALGIREEHTFVETKALHSTENIFYAYEMARSLGFKSIALVTDPLQSFLTSSFTFRRFRSPIQHLPFVMDTLRSYEHLDPKIDASDLKIKDFIPLKERESRWRSIRGTMGREIPWDGERIRPEL